MARTNRSRCGLTGQIETAEGYRNLIIKQGEPTARRFICAMSRRVIDGVENERLSRHFFARGFNPPASVIVFAVSRQAGANAVAVARSVRDALPGVAARIAGFDSPHPDFRSLAIDREFAARRPGDARRSRSSSSSCVIFVFLGRASDTLIPMVALPMSFLITFVAMWWLGYSMNNLTLMALTLAIGFLVDDAIVFLENVVRRAEAGESIYRATLNSAGEISFTILSMTLSLAAVFIPLAFMPGLLGRIFREFAITIIVAIFASGLVSLTLTPLMCSRILAERGPGIAKAWMQNFVNRFFIPIRDFYGRTLDWFLDRGWIAAADRDRLRASASGSSSPTCRSPFCRRATAASIRGFFHRPGRRLARRNRRRLQDKLDPILQANPAVDKYFTVAGRAGTSRRAFSPCSS